jgi:outer membrane protein TolC
VQLQQDEWQTNMMKLQNGIELTARALCQHIGIAYYQGLIPGTAPKVPEELPFNPASQSMVTNRIEYSLLNKNVEAQKLQQKIAVGECLPQLALSVSGSVTDMMKQITPNAMVYVTLTIPISDWWGGSHKIKQQQMKVEKARTELEDNTELLRLQITQTENELKETFFQIKVAGRSVDEARENLKITQDNYRARTISISDLLEAQTMYRNVNDKLTDAKCNYQIKMSNYLQAVGLYK